MVEEWPESGYGSVDMEAATLFAVANISDSPSSRCWGVWDQLTADRSFLDPFTSEEHTRLDAANTAAFKAALEITLALDQTWVDLTGNSTGTFLWCQDDRMLV